MAVGCSPVGPILDVEKVYRYDLEVEYGKDKSFVGHGVIPKADRYEFKFEWPGKAEILKFTTCHREEVLEFRNDRRVEFEYVPKHVEQKGFCPILVGAYDTKAQHAWAIIEIKPEDHNLEAFLNCNGENVKAKGVGTCQSKAGLFQRIAFDQPVSLYPVGECPELKGNNLGEYEFPMPKGVCTYLASNSDGKMMRLVTIGYDEVLIRRTEFN